MKGKFKKLLACVLMACMVMTVFAPVQVEAAKKLKSGYKTRRIELVGAGYYGTAKIRLLECKTGDKALKYAEKHRVLEIPGKNREFVYLKFKIKRISGERDVFADLAVNTYSGIYDSKGKREINSQMVDIDDGVGDMLTTLKKGESVVCSALILVKSKNVPVTYRCCTGFEDNGELIFTWFTTEK